jgi:hypothetical protein
MRQIYLLVPFIVVCFACRSNLVKKDAEKVWVEPFESNGWTEKLEKDTSEMKAAWLEKAGHLIIPGLNVFGVRSNKNMFIFVQTRTEIYSEKG